jgi:hypothetical protein
MRVFGDMMPSAQRPRVLLDATRAGRMPVEDLPELITFAWLHDDSPTSDIAESEWLEIFETAGFFSYPQSRSRPASGITVYRGATADRLCRMSWADDRSVGCMLGLTPCLARSGCTVFGGCRTGRGARVPLASRGGLDGGGGRCQAQGHPDR